MTKIAIHTLGCKVNQYETAALEQELLRRGYELTAFDAPADAYIINTCTVTAVSDKKSRQTIRQAKRRNPNAVVAVCGCYAQTSPGAVQALQVDLVAGTAGRMAFLDDLETVLTQRQETLVTVTDIMACRTFEPLSAGGVSGRTRAMLKVEDGCVNFCSYCRIPYARGRVRSLPLDAAARQAAELAQAGFHEIVLTGIEISSWGTDLPGTPALAELISAVCAAAPGCRIRLGSLEPRTITDAFCRAVSQLPNLCPHFHLSLQSGEDGVLQRMNRKYGTARYLESVRLLRQHFDRPGLTTDLIVGFPGEDEAAFSQTLAFLRQCAFSAVHVFPYSRREGTPAAKLPGQVRKGEKEARAHRAAAVVAELSAQWLQGQLGRTLPVLFEEVRDGLWRGHAPDYTEVFAAGENLHNVEAAVQITGVHGGALLGELVTH